MEHKQELASRGGIESWLGYLDITEKAGEDLLKNKDDFDAQLDIIKKISNEDFISVVIGNYRGDSSYEYQFKRLIQGVIEASGAALGGDLLIAKQTAHQVTVHDGKTVKKKTQTRTQHNKKVVNYEPWTKSQQTFIAVRVRQGKSRDQIYKEYNYSKSFKHARSKESINSQIDRQASTQ
jgi:hypothetical protein